MKLTMRDMYAKVGQSQRSPQIWMRLYQSNTLERSDMIVIQICLCWVCEKEYNSPLPCQSGSTSEREFESALERWWHIWMVFFSGFINTVHT